MRIGIVGAGTVGSTTAYALVLSKLCSQIVLLDVDPLRSEAQALDLQAAAPITHPVQVLAGTPADLRGCQVVVLTAGIDQNPTHERPQMIEDNSIILRRVVKQVLEAAPDALLLVATQPVDLMTDLVARLVPAEKRSQVLGLGTALDTIRLRSAIATRAQVDAQDVQAYVIGEAGSSSVIVWSQTTIGGIPIEDYFDAHGLEWSTAVKNQMADEVRRASVYIVQGKGATEFGVGAALTQVIETLLTDRKSILTVSAVDPQWPTAISMPRVVGRNGISSTLTLHLAAQEQALLQASLASLRDAREEMELAAAETAG